MTVAGMRVAERLRDFLAGVRRAGEAQIVGWRFEVVESVAVRVGIRDSRPGGPYEGPGAAVRLAGTLELHWSDGRLTRTPLDRRALTDPSRCHDAWQASATVPRAGKLPPLAAPTDLPSVQVFDPLLADAVSANPGAILDQVVGLRDAAEAAGATRTDAVVRAIVSQRAVATSLGFWHTWEDTLFSLNVWADELGGASYERRQIPSLGQTRQLAAEASTLARQLQRVEAMPQSARGVLFAPAAVDQLLGRFLFPNLAGRAIRDGRAFFTAADLAERRQVMRDDISVVIDTTLPFEPATAPCSPEGVPAGRVALMERGRLVRPLVEQESAADLGFLPTPRPRGRPFALLLSDSSEVRWDEALALLDTGIVVRDLPGLHTQASRAAAYAVVTPDAQGVIGGTPGGRCAVRLAGNIIDHVSQLSSRVVRVPGSVGVGLLVLDGMTLLPA